MSQHIDPTPKQMDLTSLNSNLTSITANIINDVTAVSNITKRNFRVYKTGNVVIYAVQFDNNTARSNGDTIFSGIPSEYRTKDNSFGFVQSATATPCLLAVINDGTIKVQGSGLPVGSWYTAQFVGVR